MKSESFKLGMTRVLKQFVRSNQGLRQCASSNRCGIICLLEEDNAKFYKSSGFKKETRQIVAIDTHKLQFMPVSAHFNQDCDNFVAIAGQTNLVVLTIDKEGKVKSELQVNLMLEAYGDQLNIVGVNWVPGSQTSLAVATHTFIRIYDLAKDNFSPRFNVSTF